MWVKREIILEITYYFKLINIYLIILTKYFKYFKLNKIKKFIYQNLCKAA